MWKSRIDFPVLVNPPDLASRRGHSALSQDVSGMAALRLFLLPLALMLMPLPQGGGGFELQDTIHALMEENIRLHEQLDNLTQALRQLKRMLRLHANDAGHHERHSEEVQHLWDDWSQHGISADTHLLLENAFCGHAPHDSAPPLQPQPAALMLLLLLSCL